MLFPVIAQDNLQAEKVTGFVPGARGKLVSKPVAILVGNVFRRYIPW